MFATLTKPTSQTTDPKVGRPKSERNTGQEPQYKVVLHNDEFNSMEHVVSVLKKVIAGMNYRRATDVMMEAHKKGKAVATLCHKELAELYREQLRSEGLTATIERG